MAYVKPAVTAHRPTSDSNVITNAADQAYIMNTVSCEIRCGLITRTRGYITALHWLAFDLLSAKMSAHAKHKDGGYHATQYCPYRPLLHT